MFPLPSFQNLDRSTLRAGFPEIEAIFKKFLAQNHIPGLAYGIVVDGELVGSGGIGVRNVEDKTPVNGDTVFRIASMTKSFTAMAIIKLRDEGKLTLESPAEKYVPELANLRYPTRDSAKITLRHLLTMSAGFPQDDPWADRQLGASAEQFSAWMKQGISFSNPPGIKFEYSNYGYGILGRIVSNVTGMPYQTYVKTNILEPLGMTSSTFDVNTVSPERLAMGYKREGDIWIADPPLNDGAFASMGGLFTTINDFSRYMAFLLSAFPARDEADNGIVRRSSLREMQQPWQPRTIASNRPTPDLPAIVTSDGYGFGLVSGIDSRLGYSVAHGGGLPGYGSFYRLLPDYGIGIAVFTNLTYSSPASRIYEAYVALQKTGGLKPRILPTAPILVNVQNSLTRLYETWDDAGIQAIATESFFQDMALEKRKQEFEKLRQDFGKCTSVTAFEPENALRGRWTMRCKRGRIEVYVTLAPTVPPLVQDLEFTAIKPLSATSKQIITEIIGLIGQWDAEHAPTLFARTMKREALRRQLDAVRTQYGGLRLGDVLEGDGKTQVQVRLTGKLGIVDLKLKLDTQSGKVTEINFLRPRDTTFVP
ncbi:MAG: serine hydrolase domain-containing protein [Chloroflexota bacterium]